MKKLHLGPVASYLLREEQNMKPPPHYNLGFEPWRVANNGRSVLAGSVKINQQTGAGGGQSASVHDIQKRELMANAKLIAAAPEMLYCLQRLLPTVNDYDFRFSPEGKELSDRINALIEKIV